LKKNKALLKIFNLLLGSFGPQQWWPGDTQIEIIVGAILTQNTNWLNVEKAITNLKSKKVLSIKPLTSLTHNKLAALIKPAGYFNVKSRRLKNFIDYVNSEYQGSLKKLGREPLDILRVNLLKVNGVGPETADSILLYAFDKPSFVVDSYTKRIFSRLGLISPDLEYSEVRSFFMDNLKASVEMFNEYHALIVRLAKENCKVKPNCPGCPLRRDCIFFNDS